MQFTLAFGFGTETGTESPVISALTDDVCVGRFQACDFPEAQVRVRVNEIKKCSGIVGSQAKLDELPPSQN